MPNIIGKVLIYGDIHLCSKNYGAHRSYSLESLEYFSKITAKAEEEEVTHIIGTGDLTYGRFNTLDYRLAVEKELEKQYAITDGSRYEIKGNHDTATYGMTEYEYYIKKGLLKPATNLQIGNMNISMVDYGKHAATKIIEPSDDTINVVIAHGYFKFSDTQLPDYGVATYLDDMDNWFGVDYLLCGHVHNYELFKGLVIRGDRSYDMVVSYLGCMSRPAYRQGAMQEEGHVCILTVYDDGTVKIDFPTIELWPLEKSFNLEAREAKQEKHDLKHIDVSDIVTALNSHERVIGNPEDVIMAKADIDIKYRKKAIELLMEAEG